MDPFSVSIILAAAGSSTRFGSDKLGQDLGGRPLLLRSVELFTKRDEVRSIIVAAPPNNMQEFRDRFGAQLSFHGVTIVAGGTIDRWETIRNALKAVPAEATHIAVHDAARPATSDDLISRVFEAAKRHDAVIPALPVADTLKRVNEEVVEAEKEDAIADLILGEDADASKAKGKFVQSTVDRKNLVAVQTPQVFKADLLRRAYQQTDLSAVTDDAALVERMGEKVLVVDGEFRNLKVTIPDDLRTIRLLLGIAAPEGRAVHKRF
ncbi:MAG: 2-C-methyl-D-erythritol 4-phosphate cytidylyltransferase [Planctomycetes bacterium]|nr:2-C-methyl-D-erythritol 4-phosphate cytidylyltransferase [Planctomycetota bacterium]